MTAVVGIWHESLISIFSKGSGIVESISRQFMQCIKLMQQSEKGNYKKNNAVEGKRAKISSVPDTSVTYFVLHC